MSSSLELEILMKLKKQLISFLDDLIATFPDQPDFIIFRLFVDNQIPIQEIMTYITTKLCPLQNLIKEKNEKFFLTNNILFEKFDSEKANKVNHFRKIWLSDIDDSERNAIWDWFNAFIQLGNKYIELTKK